MKIGGWGGGWISPACLFLQNLDGLTNLTTIGGDLEIVGDSSLQDLSGLTNLIEIGGELKIASCNSLQNLAGLENLSSIGGWLFIGVWDLYSGDFMGNSSLSSLSQLENLTSISGGISIVDNNSLSSLSGIDNIILNSIDDLMIIDNDILSTCAIQSICDYLVAPSGIIWIHDNDTGCNTQQEVEAACESVSVEEINLADNISIYPNPANNNLTISCKNEAEIELVRIYNQIGQKVLEEKLSNNTINVSGLKQGLFVFEMATGELRIRKKLVIKR